MFTGKVKDVRRELRRGFAIGEARPAGLYSYAAADHSRSALPTMSATISTSNRSRRPWRDRLGVRVAPLMGSPARSDCRSP